MNLYHTTDSEGISEINPDRMRMREILEEVGSAESADAPHPDVSLVHDTSGWMVTVYPGGVVTLENLGDADELPFYLRKVGLSEALSLWTELAEGNIAKLRKRPWLQDEN